MKHAHTFLAFNGNCREAMTFYQKTFDAALFLLTYGESPINAPKEAADRILHSTLTKNAQVLLMAADIWPGAAHQPGNNFAIFLECEGREEIDGLFSALAENGTVTMPLQDTFWRARFGTLTDRFGVNWALNMSTQ